MPSRAGARTPGGGTGRIAAKIAGLEVGPIRHAIDARWLMAYAAALGETDPRYYDTLAPAGPAAHPLFAVCYEWPILHQARAKALEAAVASLGVHATHHLVAHRPPRVGDTLFTRGRVVAVQRRPAGALVVVRLTTLAQDGQPVTTTDYGSIFRGVEADGDVTVADPLPSLRLGSAEEGPGDARPGAPPTPGPARWEDSVTVSVHLGHVYTECARIWNPIHTDPAAARAAGLDRPILHGSATLGLAISRLVARDLGGDPGRVRGIAARLTRMVEVPASFTVRGLAEGGEVHLFDAVTPGGLAVLQGAVRG